MRADIVVGTPGRILDLISRGSLKLNDLDHVVLDEVDRMLDMGFADDVDKILKNRYRQGLYFLGGTMLSPSKPTICDAT